MVYTSCLTSCRESVIITIIMGAINKIVKSLEEITPAETEEEVDSPKAAAKTTDSTGATIEESTKNVETTDEQSVETREEPQFNGNLL